MGEQQGELNNLVRDNSSIASIGQSKNIFIQIRLATTGLTHKTLLKVY